MGRGIARQPPGRPLRRSATSWRRSGSIRNRRPPPTRRSIAATSRRGSRNSTPISWRCVEAEPEVSDVTTATMIPGDESLQRIDVDQPAGASAAPTVLCESRGRGFLRRVRRADPDRTPADERGCDRPRGGGQSRVRDGACSAMVRRSAAASATAMCEHTDAIALAPEQWYEIVGVVADLQTNAIDPALVDPNVFHMLDPRQSSVLTLIVRTRGGDASALRRHGAVHTQHARSDGAHYAAADARVVSPDGSGRASRHAGDWLDHAQRAAAVGRRHLRVDVVHGVAAEKRNRHSRRDGRRREAIADQHLLEGGGSARRRRRGGHRIGRGARRWPAAARRSAPRASPCCRSSPSRWSSSGCSPLPVRPGAVSASSRPKPCAINKTSAPTDRDYEIFR